MKGHKEMKKFIADPKKWPRWPYLPMKKGTEAGFSITADYPTVVLKSFPTMRGILLQLACEDGIISLDGSLKYADGAAQQVYESYVVKRYIDVDQMLDDGWVID